MTKKIIIIVAAVALMVVGLVFYFSRKNNQSSQGESSEAVNQIVAVIDQNEGKAQPLQTIQGKITKAEQTVDGKLTIGNKSADVIDGNFKVEGLTVPDVYNVQFVDSEGYPYVLDPPSLQLWSGGEYNFTVKY